MVTQFHFREKGGNPTPTQCRQVQGHVWSVSEEISSTYGMTRSGEGLGMVVDGVGFLEVGFLS